MTSAVRKQLQIEMARACGGGDADRHARKIWQYHQDKPASEVYKQLDRAGMWSNKRAAIVGRDAFVRSLIRIVNVIPVNPEDGTREPRLVTVTPIPPDDDRLFSRFVPKGRHGVDRLPASGYVSRRRIMANAAERRRQLARWRWELEELCTRWAALGLPAITAEVERVRKVTGPMMGNSGVRVSRPIEPRHVYA